MISAFYAGAGYFAIVVACGSVLGAIRIGLLAPRIGDLAAVVVELPVILAISWFVCGALIERFAVPRRPGARFAMGGLAFALLMTAEAALSSLLGRKLSAFTAGLVSPAGAAGLAGQIVFATFPMLMPRPRPS